MNDLDLLFILRKRETWEKYSHLIKEHNLTKESITIIKDITVYYEEDSTRLEIDWETFGTWFRVVKHPTLKTEIFELYNKIFENLVKKTSSVIEADIIKAFVERDYLTRIADVALKGAEGTKVTTIEDVSTLIEEYWTTTGTIEEEDYIVTDDIHGLLSHVVTGGGVNWRLKELNLSLGPLRKGDFITITARPDSGKTTMLAAESTFIAKQLLPSQHVLWFNNEEEGRKVKFRIIQAAIGWTTKQIQDNPLKAYELYEREVGSLDRILVYDKASIHIKDIKKTLDKYETGLIIFDQLRKIKGYEKEGANEVGRLQLLFQKARELAKEYAPVINVHQARGDAEGQRWIELNQMHGSQTDIQGEVDAVVALGRTHEVGFEKSRFLYIPKNKLAGGGVSDEAYRSGKFELLIKPEIARFEGML